MDVPSLAQLDPQTATQALLGGIELMPPRAFAVLDGDHFDDLADRLTNEDVAARSLFLDGVAPDVRRAGPWLVPLASSAARASVERLVTEAPCAVFWSCPDGEQTLWRHLRTVNEVLLPLDRPDGDGAGAASDLSLQDEPVAGAPPAVPRRRTPGDRH